MKRKKPRNQPGTAAFTLLELVVVLAILSLVTALAFRSLDQVEDQHRYEANERIMRDLERAVIGSLDDRDIDGSPTISGFVADMGRLPKSVAKDIPLTVPPIKILTLGELWIPPAPAPVGQERTYKVREAVAASGVAAVDEDSDVVVASGWRGPYITPQTDENLLDGWGNPMRSLSVEAPETEYPPLSIGYPRLRHAEPGEAWPGDGITEGGQEINVIKHLGANGNHDFDLPSLPFVDRDVTIDFRDKFTATVTAAVTVKVLSDEDEPLPVPLPNWIVVVRVFGPDPDDSAKIKVVKGTDGMVTAESNVANVTVTATPPTTIGPRTVRAYLYNDIGDPPIAKSFVTRVTLHPGANLIPLTIVYRLPTAITP